MTVVRINESRALSSAGWTDRRLRNEPVMISQMARAAADDIFAEIQLAGSPGKRAGELPQRRNS